MLEDCLDKHPDGLPLKKSSPPHASIDILHDPMHCPFNFYRTGDDNAPHFIGGISHILHDTLPFLNTSVGGVQASRPG